MKSVLTCVFLLSFIVSYRWTRYLNERGYQVSSIKNMLLNVVHFFRHVEHAFLEESLLTSTDVQKILYELKRMQSDVGAKLVSHLQQVMRHKTGNSRVRKRLNRK